MNKRKIFILLALSALLGLLALCCIDWRNDHDRIRLITQRELPQAYVTKSLREGDDFAVFFVLPEDDMEQLCRDIPTVDGWQPLLPGHEFGMGEGDIRYLSGQFARVEGNYHGLAYLLRLNDGMTLVAVHTGILFNANAASAPEAEAAPTAPEASSGNAPLALQYLQEIEGIILAAEGRTVEGPEAKRQLEEETATKIRAVAESITEARLLYAMAIVLYEGYEDEFRETTRDRLLFTTREIVVHRLSKLKTKAAFEYFCLLHERYGTDAGASLEYKELKTNFRQ